MPTPRRRTFTAKYELRILAEADACRDQPGAVGSLLRREGLCSSHLSEWRRAREEGQLGALAPRKRGRRKRRETALERENGQLRRQVQRLSSKLEQAELNIGVQERSRSCWASR